MRNLIRKEIEKVVGKRDFDVFVNEKFGDYSSNVALVLNKDPKEIAKKIKSSFFEKIEVAEPGFLNFWLSEKALEEGLKNLNLKPKKKKDKIQVEFISANPTGELHIGHGRSAFYGDALANVLKMAGFKVEREYLINDSKEGSQIKELGKTALGKGTTYLTKNLKSQISNLKSKIKKTDDESEAGYLLAGEIQKNNERFIKSIGINFDRWFSEELDLRKKDEFKKTLELLKRKKFVYEKDRAWWLKTSKYGDEEDRVVVRSNGEITYFLSDITYHLDKFKRGYKKIINIWGADHQGHVKRMLAVKKMLNWKGDLGILISQLVTLKEEGLKKKLSKRKGDIILLRDLIKEIGLDVARWFYLEKSLSTHMEFDMKLAKEHSEKNPVYYVQYAGARMNSILKKSQISKSKSQIKPQHPSEIFLIKKLIQFPEIIEDITKDYQVQRLTKYAYDLAYAFSIFYRDVRVIGSQREKELLSLVALTRKILANALSLMGISSPEKM